MDAAVAGRFACPLITLDRELHDQVANLLQNYFPAELHEMLWMGDKGIDFNGRINA